MSIDISIYMKSEEKNNKTYTLHNSIISETAELYFRAEVKNSQIEEKCIIGDNSRVRDSFINTHVSVDRNNLILNCKIGRYTYTGPFDMIFHTNIGSFCSISYGVTIGPPEHDYCKLTTHPFIYDKRYEILDNSELLTVTKFNKQCQIGNDVWIGCNATILRGVNIGHGAVIGANALVNKDVPPYAIVAGVPAKIIKYRFSKELIKALLELKWWEWDIKKIRTNSHLFTNDITIEDLKKIL